MVDRITEPDRIADLVNRKSHRYSEVEIYPGLRFSDFNPDLFHKVRNLIRSKTPAHPWLAIGNEEMLVKAGFYRRDLQSGTVGYTLGAGLMFGKDFQGGCFKPDCSQGIQQCVSNDFYDF